MPRWPKRTIEERFWDKVQIKEGISCWNWTGHLNNMGYGMFWTGEFLPSGHSKKVLAHRWAYEHFVGAIPLGLHVLHRCDIPICVNFRDHLWLGTQQENIRDAAKKGRMNGFGKAVIPQEIVDTIRQRYVPGNGAKLAEELGVSPSYVRAVVNGVVRA